MYVKRGWKAVILCVKTYNLFSQIGRKKDFFFFFFLQKWATK